MMKFKILTVSSFPVHSVAHLLDLSTLMNSLSPHTHARTPTNNSHTLKMQM